MKKLSLIAVAFAFVLGFAAYAPAAQARVFVSGRFGGCCGYYGGGYYPYPAYYYPYAVAPPPVVYAVPPAEPVYESAPVVAEGAPVVTAAPAAAPAAVTTNTATFIDSSGRTCRHYEGPAPGSLNTACLQPDGTWHTVK